MTRPQRLNELLQYLAGRKYPVRVADLAERFEVSERTMFRDLAELQRSDVIAITRNEHGYRLAEGSTIRPIGLTSLERATLKLLLGNPAVRKIAGGPGTDIAKAFRAVREKLDAATREAEETPIALALAGPDRTGRIPDTLTATLETAVRECTAVLIRYNSLASGRTTWRDVDPYKVFNRDNAWYVIGRCHLHDAPRVFRLDRIKEARPKPDAPFDAPNFDLDNYLRDAWGFYRGQQTYDIEIHFDPTLGALIENTDYHPSQKIERLGNGTLQFTVCLSHLEEIARWVVAFGGRARAVQPPELVDFVATLAAGTLDAHRGAGGDAAARDGAQRDLPHLPTRGTTDQRRLKFFPAPANGGATKNPIPD